MEWGAGTTRLLAQVAAAVALLALLFSVDLARAAHVSCGQTITTNTVLDADLDCRSWPGPGLAIGAPGIELDLNGHLLDGELRNPGFDHVRIADGTLAGQLTLEGVRHNRIERIDLGHGYSTMDRPGSVYATTSHDNEFVRLSGPAPQSSLFQLLGESDRNKVWDSSWLDLTAGGTDNRFRRIRDSTIDLYGSNHVLSRSEGCRVSLIGSQHEVTQNRFSDVVFVTGDANRIAGNAFSTDVAAISVLDASSNVIERNRIHAQSTATASAIVLFQASSTVIRSNEVSGSSQLGEEPLRPSGIWVHEGTGNMVARNKVSGRAFGILLTGTVENTLDGNVVNDTVDSGIYIYTADRNVISRNEVSHAGESGITLGLSADQNQISRNKSSRNGVDGVFILAARGTGNVLSGNDVRVNGDDGIDVDVAGNTLSHNRAERNFDWGIEAVAGTIDGGGNRARGNGQPAQCSNVSCGR